MLLDIIIVITLEAIGHNFVLRGYVAMPGETVLVVAPGKRVAAGS